MEGRLTSAVGRGLMPTRAGTLEPGSAGTARAAVDHERLPRVLVIDDERIIRELLVEHLAEEGFGVDSADSISRATACIALQPPDVIVLDLMLPDRTGWEFLRDRPGDPRLMGIPVVVISAAMPERLLLAAQLGADALLSKPFDLEQLTSVLRSFVPA